MLFKLSIQNQKKILKIIQFVTSLLLFWVLQYFIFLMPLNYQTSMMELSQTKSQIINVMNTALEAMSVLVSFILGFLIAYASEFLIKKNLDYIYY